MIAKWLTRIYVLFAFLMLFGLTGLLLESLTVSLLPFLALLLCGYVGLFTLWWMGNLHQRVLTEQVIEESSRKKIIIGVCIGSMGIVVPVIINFKFLVFAIPLGMPAICFAAFYAIRWRRALKIA